MTAEAVLLVYESLLAATLSMLTLAKEGDWGALLASESQYVVEVEELSRTEQGVDFNERQQARKAALLERILHNDLQIRSLLVTRRTELGAMINVYQRKRDLNRTYKPGSLSAIKPAGFPDDN